MTTSTYLAAHADTAGLRLNLFRYSPEGELLDGICVAPLADADGNRFVRIAVFDPAENVNVDGYRVTAHEAVGIAAAHVGHIADPVAALEAAAARLYDPDAEPMCGPLLACAYVDVQAADGVLTVLSAGRVGDGDVLVWSGGAATPDKLLQAPLWTPDAQTRWLGWVERHRPNIAELWASRPLYVGTPDDYLCPPLGQFPHIVPDVVTGPIVADKVWIATDGAELEHNTDWSADSLAQRVQTLMQRQPPPHYYMSHSCGDIAAVEVLPPAAVRGA